MSEPAPEEVDFDGMTKMQLLAYAEDNDVEGVNSAMTKAEIIDALNNE